MDTAEYLLKRLITLKKEKPELENTPMSLNALINWLKVAQLDKQEAEADKEKLLEDIEPYELF